MIEIAPVQISSAVQACFTHEMPVGLRCRAVLAGDAAGRILTDDPVHPHWAVVQEQYAGFLYLDGALAAPILAQIVHELRKESEVVIGLWPDDPRLAILPANPDDVGAMLDFTQRSNREDEQHLHPVPAGFQVQRMDAALLKRCAGYALYDSIVGGAEPMLAQRVGYCLLHGDVVACAALTGTPTMRMMEMGVATHEQYRQRGYATLICLHVVRECERLGYQTYWNCAKPNVASAAIARKLGYQTEKEFRVLAWAKYR